MSAEPSTPGRDDAFAAMLADRAIYPVFQPVVSLDDGRPVGYEALARGPSGSPFETAEELLREAARRGQGAELDWISATAACAALLAHDNLDLPLFINVEPDTFGTPCPADLLSTLEAAVSDLDLVIEITERVIHRPADLLRALVGARRGKVRIALDDVGFDPSSLNMLSLLRPDVIKLDRSIVQGNLSSWPIALVLNAVLAEADRAGSVVLAEGIESPEHLEAARTIGATLGQGWHFGEPGPLPLHVEPSQMTLPRVTPRAATAGTPFGVAHDRARIIEVTRRMLDPMGRLLEDKALHTHEATMLFATFPDAGHLDDDTRLRYSHMARTGVNVTAYAGSMPRFPGAGIRGVALDRGDPLLDEKIVMVIGTHFAAGLIARQRPGLRSGDDSRYDAILTYDRNLVIEAVQTLIEKIPPLTDGLDQPWS
jgi:EAL domain-containing protein (putative c-di-GMP-specific phosphodiesterase class I)